MGIPVKLEVFEGPLDLLLHLIDKNKIDIYDIPIVLITEQYMIYIKQMEKRDLNVMSEFLLMAATLLDIKCRMLLPKEVDEDGVEEDPREELVRQLLEYKMYKHMANELKDKEMNGLNMFYRKPSIPDEIKEYEAPVDLEQLLEGVSMHQLNTVFKEVMKRTNDKLDPIRSKFGKIEKEEVTLDEKLDYVEEYTKLHSKFSFRQLLENQKSRMHIVVTFLAILEMMKSGKIRVLQHSVYDEIMIQVA